jgi:CrcB protein
MYKLFLIAIGGAMGTLCRYGTSVVFARATEFGQFPLGTLAVNLVGCFLIGLAHGLFAGRSTVAPHHQLMITTGFLGGFTTFSSFGWETSAMIHHGNYARAGTYVILSNTIGIALALAGYALGRTRAAA